MSWNQGEFLDRLKNAGRTLRPRRRVAIVRRVDSHSSISGTVLGDGMGRRILTLLRRKAYFGQMERVAEAFLFTSQDDAQIRRQYAQALHRPEQADRRRLCPRVARRAHGGHSIPRENAEARGLLGRVYKQLYINAILVRPQAAARSPSPTQPATGGRLPIWRSTAPRRRDISGTASTPRPLRVRAVRDDVPLREAFDGAGLARDILAAIEAREDPDAWDMATGAEACLVLGEPDKALPVDRPVRHASRKPTPSSSRARCVSSRRSGASPSTPCRAPSSCRSSSPSSFSAREGASTSPPVRPSRRSERPRSTPTIQATLEKILGKEGVVSLGWYKLGLDRTQAVAKILNKTGDGFGTGFLVRGRDLVPALGDTLLILTNAHVVSDDPAVQAKYGSLEPDDATIVFEASEAAGQQKVHGEEAALDLSPDQLDATLLEIDPPLPNVKPYPVAKRLPLVDGVQKVYVIGHPKGGGLSISLNDNLLLDYDDRLLHYRAPTEGGSSGSPVFNQQWDLIGLHHAGGMAMRRLKGQEGTYAANEGIWIQRIIKAIEAEGVRP